MDSNNRLWPPNSTDLNRVDCAVWSVTHQRVYETRVHDINELRQHPVYCMCGAAWSSHWLMMQLTNGQHTCVLVFVPKADIRNTICDYQFVFSVLDKLYVSNHA